MAVPGFYQWLKVTPESSYGTFDSGGTGVWVRLAGDDAFKPMKVPARTVIRSADASNRRVTNISARYAISADLKTPLYPGQAATWMGAAATLSGTPLNAGSYTFDYWDGVVIRRYLGMMCQTFDLTSTADQQYANLTMKWVGQKVDDASPSAFAAPSDASFPSESPYLHTELGDGTNGYFKLGGSQVAQFDQFHLSIKNTLIGKFYENAYIEFCIWGGRDVDLQSHLTYTSTTLRGDFEDQTSLAFTAKFYRSATKNLALDFKSVDILSDYSVSRPLGGVMEHSLTAQAFYDSDNSADFAFTNTYS